MSYIPQEMLDSLARHFLPQIKEFFESEEGQREYEEWKKKKEAEKAEEQKSNK
jgi:hypothetical protein